MPIAFFINGAGSQINAGRYNKTLAGYGNEAIKKTGINPFS